MGVHFLAKLRALIISALGVDLSGEHAPGTSRDVLKNTRDKRVNNKLGLSCPSSDQLKLATH